MNTTQTHKINNIGKTKNLPVKKFKAGPIYATVWKNQIAKDGKESEYMTVSFERRYMDKNGEFGSTSSLRLNDLPKASLVLQKVYEFIAFASDDSEEALA